MFVFHGSTNNNIDNLMPISMGGRNGSHDGIGINLTNSINKATGYAKDNSLYVVDIDTSGYLEVNERTFITQIQAEILDSFFDSPDGGDDDVLSRIHTDLCGKSVKTFTDRDEASAFFDEKSDLIKGLGISRLNPDANIDNDGNFVVSFAREKITSADLEKVTTDHLVWILNLFDNSYATTALSQISDGLILERDSGFNDYLSFARSEAVEERIELKNLSNDEVLARVEGIKNGIQSIDMDNCEKNLYSANQSGKITKIDRHFFYPDEVGIEIQLRPTIKIEIEQASGDHPAMQRIISNLVRNKPELANAKLLFDGCNSITATEFIQSESSGDKFYFHGTSSNLMSEIAEHGLLPRDISGVEAHFHTAQTNESLSDSVYLTNQFSVGTAAFAANSAAAKFGGKPIILKVPVNELSYSSLMPDEDSQKRTAQESLEFSGTVAYRGVIPPALITVSEDYFINDICKDSLAVETSKVLLSRAKESKVEMKPSPNRKNSLTFS